MTMISFSGFVVVSHNGFAVLAAIKPILQRMRTGFAFLRAPRLTALLLLAAGIACLLALAAID